MKPIRDTLQATEIPRNLGPDIHAAGRFDAANKRCVKGNGEF
ncbi:hypothetical protein [Bacillus toyonensis]|nr:hypothetical protein [Bacillus toyonensis]MCU5179273.1 hypothetical protein [Bacillus toyonensis]